MRAIDLKSSIYLQCNIGFNLASERIPIEISDFLTVGLSFSESPNTLHLFLFPFPLIVKEHYQMLDLVTFYPI